GGRLDLRGVDLVQVVGISGELPGELIRGFVGRGVVIVVRRLATGFDQSLAPCIAHAEDIHCVGVDGAQRSGRVVGEGCDVLFVTSPTIGSPENEPWVLAARY